LLVVVRVTQDPLQQTCPPGQLLPQPPQLLTSVCALTQAPSQQVSIAAQQFVPLLPVHRVLLQGQTLHWPSQQYWPLGQQVERFDPTQAVVLLGQVRRHCPLTQNWPGGQQWLASPPQQNQPSGGQQPPAVVPQQSRLLSQQRPLGQHCWVLLVQAATCPLGLKQQLLPAAMQTLPPQHGPEQQAPLQQVCPAWQQ
jgi:hypothetical protein